MPLIIQLLNHASPLVINWQINSLSVDFGNGNVVAFGGADIVDIRMGEVANEPVPQPAPEPTPEPAYPAGMVAKVGTQFYATLKEADTASVDGDTIYILPGTHLGAGATTDLSKSVNVEGIIDGGLSPTLRLDGPTREAWGKAILVPRGKNITIQNLVLEGADNPEDNGAGIRFEATCDTLTIKNVLFLGNEDGILAPDDGTMILVVEDSHFFGNGDADDLSNRGQSHNVYLNKLQEATFRRTKFTGSKYGHELKTRALKTNVEHCEFLLGPNGRGMDIPNGGIVNVSHTKFVKPANAVQKNVIGIGHEGITDGRSQSYVFDTVTIDNQRDGTRLAFDNRSSVPVQLRNVTFIGDSSVEGPVTYL